MGFLILGRKAGDFLEFNLYELSKHWRLHRDVGMRRQKKLEKYLGSVVAILWNTNISQFFL